METLTLKTPSGGEWVIKRRLTRGDRRRIDRYAQEKAIESMEALKKAGVDVMQAFQNAPSNAGENEDENDMTLVVGTVSWSFPEEVSLDGVWARDEEDCEFVLREMKRLYKRRTPEEAEALKNASSGTSSSPT